MAAEQPTLTTTPPVDLDAIRALAREGISLARAATPGPWATDPATDPYAVWTLHADGYGGTVAEAGDPYPRGINQPAENMALIAWCQPGAEQLARVVLAAADEIERLRARVAELEGAVDRAAELERERDRAAELERTFDRAAELTRTPDYAAYWLVRFCRAVVAYDAAVAGTGDHHERLDAACSQGRALLDAYWSAPHADPRTQVVEQVAPITGAQGTDGGAASVTEATAPDVPSGALHDHLTAPVTSGGHGLPAGRVAAAGDPKGVHDSDHQLWEGERVGGSPVLTHTHQPAQDGEVAG